MKDIVASSNFLVVGEDKTDQQKRKERMEKEGMTMKLILISGVYMALLSPT